MIPFKELEPYFEYIESACSYEEYGDKSEIRKVSNDTLAFITKKKAYIGEIQDLVELNYIAIKLKCFDSSFPTFIKNEGVIAEGYFESLYKCYIERIKTALNLILNFYVAGENKNGVIVKRGETKKVIYQTRMAWGEPRKIKDGYMARKRMAIDVLPKDYEHRNTVKS